MDEVSTRSAPRSVEPQTEEGGRVVVGSDHAPVECVLAQIRDLAPDQRECVVVAVLHDLDEAARRRLLGAVGATWAVNANVNPPADGTSATASMVLSPTGPASRRVVTTCSAKVALSELRVRVEAAILSGEVAVDDLIESEVFTSRKHLGRFRSGGGLAPDKVKALLSFLDTRGTNWK